MCQYIAGSKTGKRSRAGEQYFEEFNSHFWERPETPFDILHNTNTSARKRRRNRTPPPTYKVPSILSTSHRESTTNQRNRSASPIRRGTRGRNEDVSEIVTTSNNRDNGNNVNDVSGDSGHNANGVCGDLDNATYSSSSELANITSKLNTSILRSDSDLSMPDIGSSQPPSCIENINEEN
ncbi:5177_t:CDS:2 [Gigaspora margarita]|uniref:5177_t:CDS:1 n=1 Tax=Gigaspora margarita TaxID=4874 RepID=A0ABN7WLY4_GIGMA|nr:5177_t:CDS:2 [Gigaspora margarita]